MRQETNLRGSRARSVRRIRRIRKALLILITVLLVLTAAVLIAARVLIGSGEAGLRESVSGQTPSMTSERGAETLGAGQLLYDGQLYAYNEDIVTVLLLGIDTLDKVSANPTLTDGGHADTIFLAVINQDSGKFSLIAVNRDTIVNVHMVGTGENGEDIVSAARITLQHSYGDGLNESCELTRDRVSELFYDLPIHAYVSMNMGGIAELNDLLGGVEVTVLEDLSEFRSSWTKGAQITLEGEDALHYLEWRENEYEAARSRLERQKQYMNLLLEKAAAAVKDDITMPFTLYDSLKDYIVTDLTAGKVAYLGSELAGCTYDGNIYTLEGTTEVGEDGRDAFYPDEDALREMMITVFYEEVAEE